MATLIEQLLRKMGLHDEPNVLDKTKELLRLLELRSANAPLQINEFGKIVLCANLAADLLEIALDKEQALKLSGLRKSQYVNNKRMFEKILNVNKIVGINDICVQLGISEVAKKATELLQLYKKVLDSENTDIDIDHPQYAAMAVFQACKCTKKKIAKTKFMPFSNLRPTQWLHLEKRWDKFIAKHHKDTMDKLKKQDIGEQQETEKNAKLNSVKQNNVEVEDYEKWKKRILAMAENKLKHQQQDQELEKENYILGM